MTLDPQHWQDRLTQLADAHGVVGASLAIGLDGQTVEAATGVLNLRTRQPATPDSLFQIGSITKVWTATLVMQLVDDGLLDLDEPVANHLPHLRVADAEVSATVTARQLLAHTSGIDGDLFLETGRGDDALARYVDAMSDLTQVHPQGATMSYCNSGYNLLGHLVAELRGASWDDVLRERLLTPLGLDTAGTLPEEALLHGAATGHVLPPGASVPVVTPRWGLYRSCGPAGLIHSTARDQLVFAALHLAEGVTADGTRLLSERSAAAMLEEQVAVPDTFTLGSHWGLGWILMTWDGRRVHGHDGATLGQGAFLRVLPGTDLAVSLLTNGGGHARDLFEELFAEVFAELAGVTMPRRPTPPADPPPVDHARFLGTYAREGVEMTVRAAPSGDLELAVHSTGALAADQPDPPPLELRAYDHDVLLARSPGDATWNAAVFFDLDGRRYVHFGARATPRADGG